MQKTIVMIEWLCETMFMLYLMYQRSTVYFTLTYIHSFRNPRSCLVAQRKISIHVLLLGKRVQGSSCVSPLPPFLGGLPAVPPWCQALRCGWSSQWGPVTRFFQDPVTLPTTFPAVSAFRKWSCRCLMVVGLKELLLWNFWPSPHITHWLTVTHHLKSFPHHWILGEFWLQKQMLSFLQSFAALLRNWNL